MAFFKIDFCSVIYFCYNFFNKEFFKKNFKWKIRYNSLSWNVILSISSFCYNFLDTKILKNLLKKSYFK